MTKKLDLSFRLKRLPPYLFAEIDRTKQALKDKGIKLIDLSIGDPDILAPQKAVRVLCKSASSKQNQKYSLDQGKAQLRLAIKKWFKRRFGVSLNADREILPLIGSKEGLVHLPLGFVNPQEPVIIPNPGYPGYRAAAVLSGAKVYEMPLLENNKFLPDLSSMSLALRNRAKLIYLNYPNNPTTVLAPVDFLTAIVKFCSHYGIILCYDNAYSEVYFEEKPKSILEIKGAKEVTIEFHSLSKTFCMTGFRIGWAAGNEKLIRGLLKVKTNIDSGIFGAAQDAGAFALEKEAKYSDNLRKIFKQRRDIFVAGLRKLGFKGIHAQATFYVWVKIPPRFKTSMEFSRHLLAKRIVATPGVGFGKYGEGFIRFALTVDRSIIRKALDILGKWSPTA